MQEVSTPAATTFDVNNTLVDTILRYRAERPTLPLFKKRTGDQWINVTAKQFVDEVDSVAKGLVASGVAAGDRVALLSATRYEWTLIDYAIWRVGATTVAIYDTSASDQVEWILKDSGSTLLIVENDAQNTTHADVIKAATDLRQTLVIDNGAVAALVKAGEGVDDAELTARHDKATSADPATLIYTSGTTGRPKGVVLTHANFMAECIATKAAMGDMLSEGKATLLFLPLAHVFARAVVVASVENRVILGHTSNIKTLLDDFAKFRPSYILSVPRVFEKVYNSAEQKAIDGGKGAIFKKAAATAIEWSKAQDAGGAGLALKVKHTVFDKLVYSKLREALGGQCDSALSGGAPLGARLGHFFRGAGVPVYEGYGLTETTAGITLNGPEGQAVGSVGKPVAGCSVAIAEDGEVLLKGPVVFTGYWHNEQATAEALVDGWFHTGDIGKLENGFLHITGRKKELIVTAGGKNVSPAQLEDVIRAHALVSQTLVVGDNKPFIAALITLDPEAVPGWLERNGLPASTSMSELADHPGLQTELQEAIDAANATVSKAEAIKKFAILDTDFTVETGELTPTLKLKRKVIHEGHQQAIADLYT